MKLVVYIDVYFAVNTIFNFAILALVSRVQKHRQRLLRLLAGAAAGGLGAAIILCFSVLPPGLGAALQYGLLPFAMVFLSFGFLDKKSFFYQLLSFYGISFLMGGGLLAFRQEGEGMKSLLAAGTVSFLVLWGVLPEWGRRQKELQNEYEVAVSFGGCWIRGNALLDTGNRLREPVSGKPVVLTELSAIEAGLPEGLRKMLNDWSQQKSLGEGLWQTGEEEMEIYRKIRWIPYQAVGTKRGLIPGVEALEMKVGTGKKSCTKEGVMLGIVFEPLAAQGEYQFILHEDIVC